MSLTRFDYVPTTDYDTTTIAAGTSVSEPLRMGGMNVTGLVFPATWDAADVTLQGSFDGGTTWHNIVDDAGAEYTVTVVPGSLALLNYMDLEGIPLIRLRSGTSATPVNQAAEREIGLAIAK